MYIRHLRAKLQEHASGHFYGKTRASEMPANAIREPVLNAQQPQWQIRAPPALRGDDRVGPSAARLFKNPPGFGGELGDGFGINLRRPERRIAERVEHRAPFARAAHPLKPRDRFASRRGANGDALAAAEEGCRQSRWLGRNQNE